MLHCGDDVPCHVPTAIVVEAPIGQLQGFYVAEEAAALGDVLVFMDEARWGDERISRAEHYRRARCQLQIGPEIQDVADADLQGFLGLREPRTNRFDQRRNLTFRRG